MIAGSGPGWPPAAPTEGETAGFVGISKDLQAVLREFMVNYATWQQLRDGGFLELADFAERYNTKQEAKEKSPEDIRLTNRVVSAVA